jgi:Leucine-rich repeat (LRR) protein
MERFALIILLIITGCSSQYYELGDAQLRIVRYNPDLKRKDRIEALSFESMNMERLPDALRDFKNIKYLNVRNNRLDKLPSFVEDLLKIEVLFLDNNPITMLPENIGKMKNLKVLTINHTNITELPEDFYGLKLKVFLIGGTNLSVSKDELMRRMKETKVINSVD